MDDPPLLLVILDLSGTFVFAVNGALTAIRATRLDIVGVVTLGMLTGLGGGTIRDIMLDALPPATFLDWRYLLTAALGGLLAFALSFDDFIITLFNAGSLSTFPLYINGSFRVRFPPQVNVLATTVLVVSVALMATGLLWGLRSRRRDART